MSDAAQAIGGIVREVGGCHRVRGSGTLKTCDLRPLTKVVVGEGDPFGGHGVASGL